jgi:hypothetical protein
MCGRSAPQAWTVAVPKQSNTASFRATQPTPDDDDDDDDDDD